VGTETIDCLPEGKPAFSMVMQEAINYLARHADFHGMDTVRAPAKKVLGNTRSQS